MGLIPEPCRLSYAESQSELNPRISHEPPLPSARAQVAKEVHTAGMLRLPNGIIAPAMPTNSTSTPWAPHLVVVHPLILPGLHSLPALTCGLSTCPPGLWMVSSPFS